MRKRLSLVASMAAVTLLTSGCLGGGGGKTESGSAQTGGAETAKATIQLMYAFSGDQSTAFQKELKAWGDKEGIKFDFIQSNEYEVQIQSKVQSGNAPDIAIFPQPGILKAIAKQGKLATIDTQVDMAKIESDVIPGFLDSTTVDGKVYGAPMAMNAKSLYWYNKKEFEKAGYTVPKTHDEFLKLIDKMKADGKTPFCYGMESASATGWPATDIIEDYVLQTGGTEVYDKWTKGELKFDSPEIRKAFEIYNQLFMTEGNVYGGAKNASSNAFATALNPMFDAQPKCMMGKQGNFITQKGFFPDKIFNSLDEYVGMFRTPSVNGENPMLGGGDLAAAFTANDKNVKKVMTHLTTSPDFGVEVVKAGGALSPLKTFDDNNYPSTTLKNVAKEIKDSTVFRFDGSDQMPGAVGAGSFWSGMVDYTTGRSDLDKTLKGIDAAWPAN